MSFEDTSCKAEQEFSIKQDPYGHIDYALKATKFSSLTHLSIYFPTNFGAVNTRIYYIGLRGQYLSNIRQQASCYHYFCIAFQRECVCGLQVGFCISPRISIFPTTIFCRNLLVF